MLLLLPFVFAPIVMACWGTYCNPPNTEPDTSDGQNLTVATGQLCCDSGIPDPTGTCKGKNLNSYCCSNRGNDGNDIEGGCDNLIRFNVGRDVMMQAGNSPQCNFTGADSGATYFGFIGCAA
ncbi:hypothetical protein LX36DRAFT_661724 [Colletotrichum falcatum]|nr:hypothetical protein LX36DRAFT_661724 [Colletotrichum falcatum]